MPANGNVRAVFVARKRKFRLRENFDTAAPTAGAYGRSRALREQPANRGRFRNASHRQNVRGVAHVRAIFAARFVDALERAAHYVFHARIHLVNRPEVAL